MLAENEDEDTDSEGLFYDEDDEGQADQSNSDNSDDECATDPYDDDEAMIQPGNIVWGLLGQAWYPAKVCNYADLPD